MEIQSRTDEDRCDLSRKEMQGKREVKEVLLVCICRMLPPFAESGNQGKVYAGRGAS